MRGRATGLLIKVRHFWSNLDVFDHFGFEFSASITVRPELWRPVARPRMASVTSNLVCDLKMTSYSCGIATKSDGQLSQNRAHPSNYTFQLWSTLSDLVIWSILLFC